LYQTLFLQLFINIIYEIIAKVQHFFRLLSDRLLAKTGGKIYLLTEPVGVFAYRGKISQISEARGKELMAESEFLPD
jgi:hypothetical protein